jgi:hypothetical protein
LCLAKIKSALPRLVSISATAVGQQPKTADQFEQVWALASGAAKPRAVGEGPDFPAGGHVESRAASKQTQQEPEHGKIYSKPRECSLVEIVEITAD